MGSTAQSSPSKALDLACPSYAECSVQLPQDICFGSVSSGGFVAALANKVAALYAAQQGKISQQTDIRSSTVSFFRPVIPARGPVAVKTHELNIGKAWSTLRVEIYQPKLCVTADIVHTVFLRAVADTLKSVTNFSIPGLSLDTGWTITPPPPPLHSLNALESNSDPSWTCYHTAFHHHGFRRGHAYIKNYIPLRWPDRITRIDQWLAPGWDCHPSGSRDPSRPEARWTNELLLFAADNHLPVQENFLTTPPGAKLPLASVAATLGFAAAQKKAREEGKQKWRDVGGDGAVVFDVKAIHVSLTMSCEVKKKLPEEGVRFLFVRAEVKRVVQGRMDLEVLIFDEGMDLVLVGLQVAQVVEASTKDEKKANL